MAKIILVGYGQMLYSLIEGIENSNHEILGVFRNDKYLYSKFTLFFKDIFNPSKDFTIIKSKNLYDIKGDSVNSEKFYKEIQRLNPDLIIVGSWGEKFKSNILNLVPCANFHPALLPKNRGANPYFWSIYLDQKVTGLTIHFMNEKFDKGDIIMQEAITIAENETGSSLKDKTTLLAKAMVKDFLDLYDKKQIQPIKQNEEFASYEPQISYKEVIIDLNKPKIDVDRHLRALHPWASAYIKMARRYVKIPNYEFLKVEQNMQNLKPYTIIENNNKFFILKGSDFLIKVNK
ncbi:hypothetical protein IJ425_01915 [bacterium]|nr:hypothetical protein [bacterium]